MSPEGSKYWNGYNAKKNLQKPAGTVYDGKLNWKIGLGSCRCYSFDV